MPKQAIASPSTRREANLNGVGLTRASHLAWQPFHRPVETVSTRARVFPQKSINSRSNRLINKVLPEYLKCVVEQVKEWLVKSKQRKLIPRIRKLFL